MGATSRVGTAHPSGEPAFTPGLSEVRYARCLVFCEVFCRLVFVLCDSDYPFGICQQFLVRLNIFHQIIYLYIRIITKLPNSEQSDKGKVKTHKYINRQNQSTTRKL
jgi:hypothetical protein